LSLHIKNPILPQQGLISHESSAIDEKLSKLINIQRWPSVETVATRHYELSASIDSILHSAA
jgi:hypothetical protein